MINSRLKLTAFVIAAVLVLAGGSLYLFARPSPPNPGGNGVSNTSPAASANAASPVPSPAPGSSKTNITWTPTSVSAILSPGETKAVSVNFTSSKNIQRVSVQVSSALQSLVQVQPQFLDRVRKGQTRVITLTFAPPANAALGTASGTIQLKKEKRDNTDKDEGDEEPGKLLPQTLPVTVNVWQSFADATLSIAFKLPDFGTRSKVVAQATGVRPKLVLELFENTQQDFVSVLGMSIYSNPSRLSIQEWFRQTIDVNDILTTDGTFQQQTLNNGLVALVSSGGLPPEFLDQGGPVEYAFVVSAAGDRVVSISHAQDYNLTDFGYSQQSANDVLVQILSTVRFF